MFEGIATEQLPRPRDDGYRFVTVLPDGTEADMDDPDVVRAVAIWTEYRPLLLPAPHEVVLRAFGRRPFSGLEVG